MRANKFIRYIEFGHLLELFVVSAVVAIIGIRTYLQLTGYPQLSAGDLHIAHMLWGGLLLVIAFLGSLTFLNNDLKSVWAVVGGAGFGTFIDEVGKFVTNDNNYFYQPTFALMYSIFVLVFIGYRSVISKKKFSKKEYLVNSIEELKQIVTKELDAEEIQKALRYLEHSDQRTNITPFLKKYFLQIQKLPHQELGTYSRVKQRVAKIYYTLISESWFINLVSLFFIFRSAEYLWRGGGLVLRIITQPFEQTLNAVVQLDGVIPVLYAFAVSLQAIFTFLGVLVIHRSRKRAYTYFINAIIISVFILQIYNFYYTPVLAFFSTLRDVLLLSVLEYMRDQEQSRAVVRHRFFQP